MWLVYAAGVAGGVQAVFGFATGLIALGSVLAIVISFPEHEPEWRRKGFKGLILSATFAILAALIPSQTTVYMMVAANIAEAQISDPKNMELFGKVRSLVDRKLDEALIGAVE